MFFKTGSIYIKPRSK